MTDSFSFDYIVESAFMSPVIQSDSDLEEGVQYFTGEKVEGKVMVWKTYQLPSGLYKLDKGYFQKQEGEKE